jgi:hypothetical protein
MARRSLSSQVIEEVDRTRGLVSSVQDSVDPIICALLDHVQEGLHRIETMCLTAMQRNANDINGALPLDTAFTGDKLNQVRRRSAPQSHRATTRKAGK